MSKVNWVTVQVPEQYKATVENSIVESLVNTVEEQKVEIARLNAAFARVNRNTPTPRNYQSHYTKTFGARMTHLPENVRQTVRQIRDARGYKAAVEFIEEWFQKGGVSIRAGKTTKKK